MPDAIKILPVSHPLLIIVQGYLFSPDVLILFFFLQAARQPGQYAVLWNRPTPGLATHGPSLVTLTSRFVEADQRHPGRVRI